MKYVFTHNLTHTDSIAQLTGTGLVPSLQLFYRVHLVDYVIFVVCNSEWK